MLHRRLFCLALAVLAAPPALAADVTLGGRAEVWYDDNVLGREHDVVSDGELLITPTLGIAEHWGTVEAELEFKPNYELFFEQDELRGFNYQADGSLAFSPTARTSFVLSDDFWRYRNLRLLSNAAIGGSTPAENGSRDRFTRNIAQLTASHRITPVDVIQATGAFSLWDFSDASRFDQQSASAGLNYQHHISRSVALGAGASFSRLTIEALGANPERHTDYVNFSLIANYEPADKFFIRASAGPTYVRQPPSRQPSLVRGQLYSSSGSFFQVGAVPSTCPTLSTGEQFDGPGCNLFDVIDLSLFSALVQRFADAVPLLGGTASPDEFTYFADVSVERTWEAASLSLAYRRDEGSNTAAGFSTVADTVELRGMLQPREELTLFAAVVWENRKETQAGAQYAIILDTLPASGALPAIDFFVPVGVRALNGATFSEAVETISAYASANYRLTSRVRLDGTFSWRDQRASASSFFNDYERFFVMLGLSVELEPFRW
jgi:hypothetical protein